MKNQEDFDKNRLAKIQRNKLIRANKKQAIKQLKLQKYLREKQKAFEDFKKMDLLGDGSEVSERVLRLAWRKVRRYINLHPQGSK